MGDWVFIPFLVFGSFLMMLAGIGVLRMPDTYLRMSVTAKAGTLGVGILAVGAALFFNEFSLTTRSIAIVAFLFLTSPVAAHMLGRAAYFDGVPMWEGTVVDELRGHYSRITHSLDSEPVDQSERVPPLDEADSYE